MSAARNRWCTSGWTGKTAILLKQLKVATGVEIQQVIAFSVSELIRQHPELKTIIKDFLTKLNE